MKYHAVLYQGSLGNLKIYGVYTTKSKAVKALKECTSHDDKDCHNPFYQIESGLDWILHCLPNGAGYTKQELKNIAE